MSDPKIEQITFTENESKAFTKFLNFVAKSAKFEFNTTDAFEYTKAYVECLKIEKMIHDHIFEVKKITHISDKKDSK